MYRFYIYIYNANFYNTGIHGINRWSRVQFNEMILEINMVFPIKAMFSLYHKVAIVPREGFVTISFSERYMPNGKEIMKTEKHCRPE